MLYWLTKPINENLNKINIEHAALVCYDTIS